MQSNNLIKNKKYFFIEYDDNYQFHNRPFEFFKHDPLFKYKKITDLEEIKNFLSKIDKFKKHSIVLLFISCGKNGRTRKSITKYYILCSLLEFAENLNKITIIPSIDFDYWYNSWNFVTNPYYKYFNLNIFKYNTFKYLCPIDYKKLGYVLDQDTYKYQNNIIEWAPHSCYQSCIKDINYDPINLILVSGQVRRVHYPEREKILNFENTVCKTPGKFRNIQNMWLESSEGSYSDYLNEFICCFASGRKCEDLTLTNKYNTLNTHNKFIYTDANFVVLKVFEILGSGSLLLIPLSYKSTLEDTTGLINGKHFLTVDMSCNKKIQNTINFILDYKNRSLIDKIRSSGHFYAKKYLSTEKQYKTLRNIILNL